MQYAFWLVMAFITASGWLHACHILLLIGCMPAMSRHWLHDCHISPLIGCVPVISHHWLHDWHISPLIGCVPAISHHWLHAWYISPLIGCPDTLNVRSPVAEFWGIKALGRYVSVPSFTRSWYARASPSSDKRRIVKHCAASLLVIAQLAFYRRDFLQLTVGGTS